MEFIISLIAGYLTGFLLSIPPGPINFIVLESGLKKLKKEYLLISLGGASGDFLYTLVAIFWRISQEYVKVLKLFFTFTVGIFLLFLGILYLRNSLQIDKFEKEVGKKSYNPFLKGILFSLANPLFLITMIAIVELYFSVGVLKVDFLAGILFSLGLYFGTFSWLAIVGVISHKVFKIKSVSERGMKKFISIMFLILGIYFLGKFIFIMGRF